MKIRVYCDSGGFSNTLKILEKNGGIEILYYPYENENKNIKNEALPSAMTWNDMRRLWRVETYTWREYVGSEKLEYIKKLLISKNRKDIFHLDSAYKSRCDFFVTSDKRHIYSRKDELFKLLNIKVCLHMNLDEILDAIKIKK